MQTVLPLMNCVYSFPVCLPGLLTFVASLRSHLGFFLKLEIHLWFFLISLSFYPPFFLYLYLLFVVFGERFLLFLERTCSLRCGGQSRAGGGGV